MFIFDNWSERLSPVITDADREGILNQTSVFTVLLKSKMFWDFELDDVSFILPKESGQNGQQNAIHEW